MAIISPFQGEDGGSNPLTRSMKKILQYYSKNEGKKITFNILLYFLITFVVARIYVYSFTWRIFIKGNHIHHLDFGIIILAIVGYWLLVDPKMGRRLKIAKLYGVGLGLTFDEFGMWFHLQDNYYARASYDAIIVISIILINIIYLEDTWKKILKKIYRKILQK